MRIFSKQTWKPANHQQTQFFQVEIYFTSPTILALGLAFFQVDPERKILSYTINHDQTTRVTNVVLREGGKKYPS
jgi:hypothetical protein